MPPALRGSGVGGVPPPGCKARRKATMQRTACCWRGVTATTERAQSRGRAAQTPCDLWQTQKELSEGWSSSKRGRRNRPPVCQEKQGLTWSWRLGRSDLRAGSAPRETTRPAEGGEEASQCWHGRRGLAGPAWRHGLVDEADCRPVHVPEGTSAVWRAVSQPGAQRPRTEPQGRGREEAGGPKAHPRRGEKGTEHAVGTRWPPGATGPLAAPYRAKRSPAVGAGVRPGRAPHRTRAVRHRSLPRCGSSRPNRPKLGRPSPRARASDRAGLAGWRDRGAACQTAEPAQPACRLPQGWRGGQGAPRLPVRVDLCVGCRDGPGSRGFARRVTVTTRGTLKAVLVSNGRDRPVSPRNGPWALRHGDVCPRVCRTYFPETLAPVAEHPAPRAGSRAPVAARAVSPCPRRRPLCT